MLKTYMMIAVSLLVAMAVTPNIVSANVFSPIIPCSGNFLGMPFPPGCCLDECYPGEYTCSADAKYMIPCGDYDTWIPFDFDQCYEYSPSPAYGWIECSTGMCIEGPDGLGSCREYQSESTCEDKCAEGDRRCGGSETGIVGATGVYICREETSPYNPYYGCNVWQYLENCGETAGGREGQTGGCSQGQCQTRAMVECSGGCNNPDQHKCIGNNLVPCVEVDPVNHCWDWSDYSQDYWACSFGCYGSDGVAQCMTQSGDPQPFCNPTDVQCNPASLDYKQLCDVETDNGYKWNTDLNDPECREYDPSTGKFSCFCSYGCDQAIGTCRTSPLDDDFNMTDAFPYGDACTCDPNNPSSTANQRECSGDEYYQVCTYDPLFGLCTWGPRTRCWDGYCFNGQCVTEVPGGYILQPDDIIGKTPSGMVTDGRYFYVSGILKNESVWFTGYNLFRFNMNGSYIRSFNITDKNYTYKLVDAAWSGSRIYGTSFEGCGEIRGIGDGDKYCMKIISIDGDDPTSFTIYNTSKTDYNEYLYTGGIAYGNDHLWYTSARYGITKGNSSLNSFCTYIGGFDTFAQYDIAGNWNRSICANPYSTVFGVPWSMMTFDQKAQRFYLMETQIIENDNNIAGIPTFMNSMKVFGANGQYFGYFNVSYYPWFGAFNWQTGFTKYNDYLYYLLPGRGSYSGAWAPGGPNTAKMEWETSTMAYSSAENECFEGAEHCEWNYIVDCVKITDNKGASAYKWWKPYYYIDQEWARDNPEPYQMECNGTQRCFEQWVNHKFTEASCENIQCPTPRICEPGETMCDSTERFQINCTYRDISWNALAGNISCWTWEKEIDAMPCAPGACFNDVCQVPVDRCFVNESRCIGSTDKGVFDYITGTPKTTDTYIGKSYIQYCRLDQYGYNYWDSANMIPCAWGCIANFNETSNWGYATCMEMDSLPTGIKNTVNEYAIWMRILFPDQVARIGFSLLFLSALAIIFLYFKLGSKSTSIMMVLVSLVLIFMNWLPVWLIAFPIVVVAFMLYKKLFGNGGDE